MERWLSGIPLFHHNFSHSLRSMQVAARWQTSNEKKVLLSSRSDRPFQAILFPRVLISHDNLFIWWFPTIQKAIRRYTVNGQRIPRVWNYPLKVSIHHGISIRPVGDILELGPSIKPVPVLSVHNADLRA